MFKSPAWWSIAITIVGGVLAFIITRTTVEASTDTRVTTLERQVPAMEQRLNDRMDKNKEELRDDIKELRRLMLEHK